MSVLHGLMISLDASSIMGKREYLRIGDCEGMVSEVSMLATRIQTGSGEEISLPNSMIVSSATRNFSRAVPGQGHLLETTLSIGYDTSWHEVVAMVEEATHRTPDVLRSHHQVRYRHGWTSIPRLTVSCASCDRSTTIRAAKSSISCWPTFRTSSTTMAPPSCRRTMLQTRARQKSCPRNTGTLLRPNPSHRDP